MRTVQEVFDFSKEESLDWSDFIESSENQEALAYLTRWPNWNFNGLVIVGEHGVGKTHLATLWAQSANAVCVLKSCLNSDPRDLFDYTHNNKCNFVFDNFQDFLVDQHWLFDFYNIAKEKHRSFIITDVIPPSMWNISLKDLKSRLSLLPVVRVSNHSDELLFKVTKKLAKDYDIKIEDNVVEYILMMCRRDIPEISRILKTLDKLSLQQKKPLNLGFVKKYLRPQISVDSNLDIMMR